MYLQFFSVLLMKYPSIDEVITFVPYPGFAFVQIIFRDSVNLKNIVEVHSISFSDFRISGYINYMQLGFKKNIHDDYIF